MGKQAQDAHGSAMSGTSLLGVVAGLLESGMMDVFGTGGSTGDGGSRATPKSYGGGSADHASSGRPMTAEESPQRHGMMTDSGLSLNKRGADSDPYCDMPELDRLGMITCPVSSEEEEDFRTAESRSSNGSAHLAERRTTTTSGAPSGRAKSAWTSTKCQDFSNSNASTLVPGLTPTFCPSAVQGSGVSGTADTSARNWRSWVMSHDGPTSKNNDSIKVHFPQKAAPEAAEEPKGTPVKLSAIPSDSTESPCSSPRSSRSRELPAPLDLSAIAGPTPPKSFASNTNSSAARSDKPLVLQSAALEQLNRMGGAKQARGRSREVDSNPGLKDTVPAPAPAPAPARWGGGDPRRGQRALQEGDDSDEHDRRHREDPSPLNSSEEDSSSSSSSNRSKQDGRGRPALRGRGARPRTWTELDAANFSRSPSPQRNDTVENTLRPPRLVQQPPGVVSGPGADLVSPGALSRPSFATMSTAEPDGICDDAFSNSHLYGGSGSSKSARHSIGRGGDAEAMRAQARGRRTDEEMGKPPSTLAEVAADLAVRGSIATAELVPGLGRSAFENISAFNSANAPTRKLATAAATAETAAAVATQNSRASAVRGSSGIGGVQVEPGSGLDKWAGSGVQDLKPPADAVTALPSRSSGVESRRSSSRVPRTAYSPQVPHVPQPDESPPALNQPHAPGRVFRPMNACDGMQQHGAWPARVGQSAMGSVKIPLFRLPSSNRLTSFSSVKGSAPGSPPAATPEASAAFPTAEAEDLRDEEAPAPRRNGERVLLNESSRPLTIDMLSSFGSNTADERLHTRVAPSDARAAAGGGGHREDDFSILESIVDIEGDMGDGDGFNSLRSQNREEDSRRSRSRIRTAGENDEWASGNSQSRRKSHRRPGSRGSDVSSTQRSRSRPRNRDGRNSSRGSSPSDRRRPSSDDEHISEHRSSHRSPHKSTKSSRQSTSGSRRGEENKARGRRGRGHRRRPSSKSANVITGGDDAEGMTYRDGAGSGYPDETDVTRGKYGSAHGETAGSRVSGRPSRGHESNGRRRRSSSCPSDTRSEKPRSEVLEHHGSGDDDSRAPRSSREEGQGVRRRTVAAERGEGDRASARGVSEYGRGEGLLLEREADAMTGHRRRHSDRQHNRRKSEQIPPRARGNSVDSRDPFASLKNRVFRSEPPPPRPRSSSVGPPARKSRALFGMPLFGSGGGRRNQQDGGQLSLQQEQQHGRRSSRYSFRSSDRRALNSTSSGHGDEVYSREVISGCASFFKRKILCQVDGPSVADPRKRPVSTTEMSVDRTDSTLSYGNGSVLGSAVRTTENANSRSSAYGASPPISRFGHGADGRQLSQLYACRQSDSGSREIDFKEFEILRRAKGGDDFTEERYDSLRVQHFLRTSQVHTVRMKPSYGRSDFSPERGY